MNRRNLLQAAATTALVTATGNLTSKALAATSVGAPAGAKADAFVRAEGTRFMRNGDVYRYVGANVWYLAWLGTDGPYGDRGRLGRELDRLKAMGVTNVRVLAGAEESPVKNSIKPGFLHADGKLNHDLLTGLDYAMAQLARRSMTAVLYITNNWEWSGGMMSLLYYATGKYINNNDPAHPFPAFPDYGSAFYSNPEAVQRNFAYVRALVTRTNSVTGVRYADDPTLMSWQLCNEPRPGVTPALMKKVLPSYYKWIDDSAALIRSLDPNHMVSLGHEGTIATASREDIVLRAHRNIDYMTAHIWPLNWSWVDGKNLAGTWDAGKAKVEAYLAQHERLAKTSGKPLVFEEFGFPRDGELYDPSVPTTFRERYYRLIYAAAEASLAKAGPVQGTNFWAWNGEARAQHADHHFRDGDTRYMGDPPHEPQGWYGNFDSDTAMLEVISAHARTFASPEARA